MKHGPKIPRRRMPVFSALLVCALAGLYGRSYWRCDVVGFYTWTGSLQAVGSDYGKLYFFVSGIRFGAEQAMTVDRVSCSHVEFEKLMEQLRKAGPAPEEGWGFMLGRVDAVHLFVPEGWFIYGSVPQWLPLGLAVVLFLLRLRGYLVYRGRKRRGLCLVCGYDLRATPGRCPECGAVAAGETVA